MLLVGGALVLASLSSAFRTVVMPRAAFDPVTRAIFLGFRSFMVGIAKRTRRLDHEVVLGAHAPLGLLTMALAWAVGIILGFSPVSYTHLRAHETYITISVSVLCL